MKLQTEKCRMSRFQRELPGKIKEADIREAEMRESGSPVGKADPPGPEQPPRVAAPFLPSAAGATTKLRVPANRDSFDRINSPDMSDVDQVMDGSAASEEEVESQPSQTSKSSSNTAAAAEIVEGKRTKKTVERLDMQAPQQRLLRIGDGTGEKLGDIPRTCYQISRMKPADLKPLHTILFDRPGKMSSIKKNLRLFNGFTFKDHSEEYTKKRERLLRNLSFTNRKLKEVCGVLDLEKKGTHVDLVDRILTFLLAPRNSGKRLPIKRRRRSKKTRSGDETAVKTKSRAGPPSSSKPGSKSKAIVMDSSSDEEQDGGDMAAGDRDQEPSDQDQDEEECPRSKAGRGRTQRSQTAPPPPKRTKKELSDASDGDGLEKEEKVEEKSRKKKPAARTKKADSSSKSPNTADSSEDEPLINMVKTAPGDEELKETLRSLLEEADLQETTMKKICQRVFDRYPDHDLSNRKDYIKQTVKSLITGVRSSS